MTQTGIGLDLWSANRPLDARRREAYPPVSPLGPYGRNET